MPSPARRAAGLAPHASSPLGLRRANIACSLPVSGLLVLGLVATAAGVIAGRAPSQASVATERPPSAPLGVALVRPNREWPRPSPHRRQHPPVTGSPPGLRHRELASTLADPELPHRRRWGHNPIPTGTAPRQAGARSSDWNSDAFLLSTGSPRAHRYPSRDSRERVVVLWKPIPSTPSDSPASSRRGSVEDSGWSSGCWRSPTSSCSCPSGSRSLS